jgi:hypothetical protein
LRLLNKQADFWLNNKMTLDEKMSDIMGDLKFPCENHSMTHRGVRGLLRAVHRLAEKGKLRELNENYKNMKCPKLRGYILDIYETAVKKKAHRLAQNGEIIELDALYRAQNCEELHNYIMNLYESEKRIRGMDYD